MSSLCEGNLGSTVHTLSNSRIQLCFPEGFVFHKKEGRVSTVLQALDHWPEVVNSHQSLHITQHTTLGEGGLVYIFRGMIEVHTHTSKDQ